MLTRQLYLRTIRKACHLSPVALHEFTLQSIMVLSGLHLWHLQFSHAAAEYWCHLERSHSGATMAGGERRPARVNPHFQMAALPAAGVS
jgi:hypothetical protein